MSCLTPLGVYYSFSYLYPPHNKLSSISWTFPNLKKLIFLITYYVIKFNITIVYQLKKCFIRYSLQKGIYKIRDLRHILIIYMRSYQPKLKIINYDFHSFTFFFFLNPSKVLKLNNFNKSNKLTKLSLIFSLKWIDPILILDRQLKFSWHKFHIISNYQSKTKLN